MLLITLVWVSLFVAAFKRRFSDLAAVEHPTTVTVVGGKNRSDSILGVCAGATSTHGVGVTAELDKVATLDLQDLLESGSDLHKRVLATGLALSSCP